jgi:hypothetical protein
MPTSMDEEGRCTAFNSSSIGMSTNIWCVTYSVSCSTQPTSCTPQSPMGLQAATNRLRALQK